MGHECFAWRTYVLLVQTSTIQLSSLYRIRVALPRLKVGVVKREKSNPSSSGVGQRPVNPDEILGGVWPETANRRRHKIGHETRQHVFARTWTNETAYSIRVGCGYVCVD